MSSYWKDKRVVITGANGFVGRHLAGALMAQGCVPFAIHSRTHDLRREESVADLFRDVGRIDVLFHLAANVGGIGANAAHPARMYSDNVKMDTLLIEYATAYKVGCLVGMGSVCAYPKHAPIPFKEESLWDGYPEETNAAYGLAKRGMLACLMAHGQEHGLNWRYALSTNLYGPGDNYGEGGHVVAHLIKRFREAAQNESDSVTLWGTGEATRDFLYVGDVAYGLLALAELGYCRPVNLGSGYEISVENLALLISDFCDYSGLIKWDASKPNGQPRRVLDISLAEEMGWYPRVGLRDGVARTIKAYREAVYA